VPRTRAGTAGSSDGAGGNRHSGDQPQRREDRTGRTALLRHARPGAASCDGRPVPARRRPGGPPAGGPGHRGQRSGLEPGRVRAVLRRQRRLPGVGLRLRRPRRLGQRQAGIRQRRRARRPAGRADRRCRGRRLGGSVRRGNAAPVRAGRPADRGYRCACALPDLLRVRRSRSGHAGGDLGVRPHRGRRGIPGGTRRRGPGRGDRRRRQAHRVVPDATVINGQPGQWRSWSGHVCQT
jgi:hypothetical protein